MTAGLLIACFLMGMATGASVALIVVFALTTGEKSVR